MSPAPSCSNPVRVPHIVRSYAGLPGWWYPCATCDKDHPLPAPSRSARKAGGTRVTAV
jgi:hypothetical protein